jgi:oxygen-independent coproporphyrinogen-3 oxidase
MAGEAGRNEDGGNPATNDGILPMTRVRFDGELLRRYGGRGPRYTSYPTAPQFTPAFGEADYRRHAAQSNAGGSPPPLSLYLHLPFCRSLCYYCGCTKFITRNDERTAHYLDTICREAHMHGALYDRIRLVEQLHLGGGTPTYYSDEQLERLMETLRDAFTFAAPKDLQCSVEIDPRTVPVDRLGRLAAMGFNRVSLGVQDFDPDVQASVNRVQSREDTLDLIDAARFARTLETVVEARPDRISLYSYAHMPQLFKAQKLIDASQLPDGAAKLALLELSIATLCDAGYEYIGMDHFALSSDELVRARDTGHLHRNFQGYSTHAYCDLVSLGASAIGQVAQSFYQNEKNTNAYCKRINDGRFAIVRGLARDTDDRLRASVIQDLMCQGRIDIPAVERRYGIRFGEYFAAEMADLVPVEADGLVETSSGEIRVTATGQLLLRPIAMVFDRYLHQSRGAGGYSKVI